MSRCTVCNVILSEQEIKHKDPLSGRYTDMCTECLTHHEQLVHDPNKTEDMTIDVYLEDEYSDDEEYIEGFED